MIGIGDAAGHMAQLLMRVLLVLAPTLLLLCWRLRLFGGLPWPVRWLLRLACVTALCIGCFRLPAPALRGLLHGIPWACGGVVAVVVLVTPSIRAAIRDVLR
ncbi:MAG: hypothetical protein JST66_08510 [Bacteroidetes bacterium]|nr:hypothetical protein [Bacteroidota bacterium]